MLFTILRNRFLKPLHSLTPKSLITPFCSSSNSSEPEPNSTSQQVIGLLRSHGFTETHISRITQVRPGILFANPHKSIAPKIDFFLSIGIPKSHIPKLVCSCPALVYASLKNQLIPCHSFLKSVLVTDENVIKMLMRSPRILSYDAKTIIAPNVKLLTELGISKTLISTFLIRSPNVACDKHPEFKRAIEVATGMGFDLLKPKFLRAVQVLVELSKTTWDRKWMLYKSYGLSDDETGAAFLSQPLCFSLSEQKISKGLDFFVNEMGRKAGEIARSSTVLLYSLENRIKPQCRVIKVLICKGFLKKSITLTSFLAIKETKFLEKFVIKFEDKVPGLLSIYQEGHIV